MKRAHMKILLSLLCCVGVFTLSAQSRYFKESASWLQKSEACKPVLTYTEHKPVKRVTSIKVLVREMTEARKVANHMENYKERAFEYEEKVRPYLDQIRDHIDHLEMEVDDEIWPLPKYRELLFTK
jgi:glutamine synthetase type III